MILPLIWMISAASKPSDEVFSYPIRWIPSEFMLLENIQQVFEFIPFHRYFFNSVLVATCVTLTELFFSSLAGFSLSKYGFPGRDIVFLFILATMMISFIVILIPEYIIMRDLGVLDTYGGLIIPGMLTAFGVFMMRQFIMTLPDAYLDAARIDGCSEFGIYCNIILPMIKPALASLAIFKFMGNWQSYLWPLVVTSSKNLRTLPLGIALFEDQYLQMYNHQMAAALIADVPILVLFALMQRHFIKGITMSGIKG